MSERNYSLLSLSLSLFLWFSHNKHMKYIAFYVHMDTLKKKIVCWRHIRKCWLKHILCATTDFTLEYTTFAHTSYPWHYHNILFPFFLPTSQTLQTAQYCCFHGPKHYKGDEFWNHMAGSNMKFITYLTQVAVDAVYI
jgi:hypothetical protein